MDHELRESYSGSSHTIKGTQENHRGIKRVGYVAYNFHTIHTFYNSGMKMV
jgi:hypothetical protein